MVLKAFHNLTIIISPLTWFSTTSITFLSCNADQLIIHQRHQACLTFHSLHWLFLLTGMFTISSSSILSILCSILPPQWWLTYDPIKITTSPTFRFLLSCSTFSIVFIHMIYIYIIYLFILFVFNVCLQVPQVQIFCVCFVHWHFPSI